MQPFDRKPRSMVSRRRFLTNLGQALLALSLFVPAVPSHAETAAKDKHAFSQRRLKPACCSECKSRKWKDWRSTLPRVMAVAS